MSVEREGAHGGGVNERLLVLAVRRDGHALRVLLGLCRTSTKFSSPIELLFFLVNLS